VDGVFVGWLGADAPRAVDAVGSLVDLLDASPQGDVRECPLGGRTSGPGVVASTRHTEHAGKTGDGVVWLLFVDRAEPHLS